MTADDVREKEVWQIWVGEDKVGKVRILDFILSEDKKPLEGGSPWLPWRTVKSRSDGSLDGSWERWEESEGTAALTMSKIWGWRW